MIGQIIQGKFEILDELGHGGMGVVYRARQLALDRIVALKMLSGSLVENEEFRERFRQEAKIIARLSHPNIIQVYDIYDLEDEDGGFCIVMEYVNGPSLREVQRALKGPMAVDRATAIAEQIAAGLGYAHREGIIHRDVKPDNVMMLPDDRVKIMDFGIARLRGSSVQTRTGVSMGTPQYMSPEQAAGKPVDARSDLYSLAVVLYGMVTGRLPFTGESPVTVALKHIQEPPPRPSEIHAAIPPALDAILLKGMAKKPSERFQTAEEFCAALHVFHATPPGVATPATGEETYVSPVPPSTPVSPLPWESTASAEAVASPPATPTATPITTPVPQSRFNWVWLIAFGPGVLALIIVVAFLVRHEDRISRADVENTPLPQFFSRLTAMPPEEIERVLARYEDTLYGRVKAALQDGELSRWTRFQVLMDVRRTIMPYLAEPAQQRWQALMPRRNSNRARPSEERFQALLNRLRERVPPDPERAREAYNSATAVMSDLASATDATSRSILQIEALAALVESVRYDRTNWEYSYRLADHLVSLLENQPISMPLLFQMQVLREIHELVAAAWRTCPPQRRPQVRQLAEKIGFEPNTRRFDRDRRGLRGPDRSRPWDNERDRDSQDRFQRGPRRAPEGGPPRRGAARRNGPPGRQPALPSPAAR